METSYDQKVLIHLHFIFKIIFLLKIRYGGTLVVDEDISAGDLLIVFFSVMIGAAQLGQVGPNVEAFAIARGSAFFIYQILSRVPPIDSMSDEGTKPKISGGIEFKECRFEYPSRKEVKVRLLFSHSGNPLGVR